MIGRAPPVGFFFPLGKTMDRKGDLLNLLKEQVGEIYPRSKVEDARVSAMTKRSIKVTWPTAALGVYALDQRDTNLLLFLLVISFTSQCTWFSDSVLLLCRCSRLIVGENVRQVSNIGRFIRVHVHKTHGL